MTEWIAGRRPVVEAIAAGREARRILLAPTVRPSPEVKRILADARRAAIPVEAADRDRLTRLAGFDGHQGILLEVGPRRFADPAEMLAGALARGRDPLIVIVDHLQDPANLGTLLRAADAAGVDGVVYPIRAAAPLTPATIKASAGASEHLRLAPVESLLPVVRELRGRGLRLVAADQGAADVAWDVDLGGPLAVAVGSEGRGLAGPLRRQCDLLVRFPMAGRVASLNAATAGALLLFEVVRQRSAGRPLESQAGPT